MSSESRLFLELLFAAAILMSIMFINNIFLYKQKIRDLISLMLISGIATCVLEMLWEFMDGQPVAKELKHLCVSCYCVVLVIFVSFLNWYLLDRMRIRFGKKRHIIVYAIPLAVIVLLCVASPRRLFFVDENNNIQTTDFFDYLFLGIELLYILVPILFAGFLLVLDKKNRPIGRKTPASVFIFGVMAPVLFILQVLLIGEELSKFETTSMPISLALMYLITNVSTHSALNTRAKMEAVESEMRIASKIQADALPPVAPEFSDFPDINLRGSMNTAKEVGGDFFDYFAIDDRRICFLIADVSGKGTPAALFMMTAKTMIKDFALTHDSTSEIFTAVNARLCENNDAGMFATAWIGIVDTQTKVLQYTNAGHNYPVFLRRGQPCELLEKVHGLFLAGMEFTRYRQSELQLEPGDRLLLYTDGVTEAHDKSNGLYGTKRLEKMLETTRDCPGEQVLERILGDVNAFARDVDQFDDITMIVLSIKDKEEI